MSAYNDSVYLSETIESVLSQTFSNFEFIIVNDGSPDPNTEKIIRGYASSDHRIKIISKENEGLTRALIDGCNAANGKYIARIDVGDTMLPHRLRLQKEVLDKYPAVGFVSCWTDFFGPQWEWMYTKKGADTGVHGKDIANSLLQDRFFDGPSCHPSVMMRMDIYKAVGGYRHQFYYAQDADLWSRFSEKAFFHIIPDVLYRARVFPNGISNNFRSKQAKLYEYIKATTLARRNGQSESVFLDHAVMIKPDGQKVLKAKTKKGSGQYFIAEVLRQNNDFRCKTYFFECLRENPCHLKALYRLFIFEFMNILRFDKRVLLQTISGRLRSLIWRFRGVKIDRKVKIGAWCRFDRSKQIKIGLRCEVESNVWFKLVTPDARFKAGSYCFFGRNTEFDVYEGVTIGSHVLISPDVFITDHDHNISAGRNIDSQGCTASSVVIDDDVWVGTRAVILRGVHIHEGCVIGAGAVVTGDLPKDSIAVGVPAKVIGYRK